MSEYRITMDVIGLRCMVHAAPITGSDTTDDYVDEEVTYVLIAKSSELDKNGRRYPYNQTIFEIEVGSHDGPCGSGYCMSTYGYYESRIQKQKKPFTHIPKRPLSFEAVLDFDYETHSAFIGFDLEVSQKSPEYEEHDDNSVFMDILTGETILNISESGDDPYYPSGYGYVNLDLFKELPRAMNKRPVWIFKGQSALGKSTIASDLLENSVFETDSVDELPDDIYQDVIVLGNRSGFTVDDVKAHLFGDPKVILVEFKEGE